jgi:hypothetical protein
VQDRQEAAIQDETVQEPTVQEPTVQDTAKDEQPEAAIQEPIIQPVPQPESVAPAISGPSALSANETEIVKIFPNLANVNLEEYRLPQLNILFRQLLDKMPPEQARDLLKRSIPSKADRLDGLYNSYKANSSDPTKKQAQKLVELANKLDAEGKIKEANIVDRLLKKILKK